MPRQKRDVMTPDTGLIAADRHELVIRP